WVSQGANAWLNPPRALSQRPDAAGRSISIGSNVDAADVNEDLLAGQSETAIAASASGRVVAAWNDATGFAFQQANRLQASNNVAFLDKDFLAWDGTSRTLAVSFTRFFISGSHSGQGEIDVARAHVPAAAQQLRSGDFRTVKVWAEEPNDENEGAYPAVAPGGDTYVAWERNVDSNLFNGDPHIYEHLAFIPPDANAPARGGHNAPVVVTQGQVN